MAGRALELPEFSGTLPLMAGRWDECTWRMTTHTLRRWGAVLLAGGLLLTAAYLIYPASAHDALIRPAAGLGLAGVLLALPGLIAFQIAQSARARMSGWIGTVLLALGIASLEIPHLVMGLFDPRRLYDLDSYHASTFGAMEFYGVVALALGMVVLAVATWRSGFYPRLAVWLLVANIVVCAVGAFVPAFADAVRQPAPCYLLMALLGVAMRQAAEHPSTISSSQMESATSPVS
jgi:hypothetical protein